MPNRQIAGLTTRTLTLADVIPTQDAASAAEAGKNTIQQLSDLLIPKQFVAYISQTFPNPPVAIVLRNTLGGTPVFTKSSTGSFRMTLAGAFPSGKVFIHNGIDRPIINFSDTNIKTVQVYRNSNDQITFLTWFGTIGSGALSDNVLSEFDLKIEVYP